eukprot:953892_1
MLQKMEMNYKLIPKIGYDRIVNVLMHVYVVLSCIIYVYPIFWFAYVWIYLVHIAQSNVIHTVNDSQILFVWMIFILYCLVLCIGISYAAVKTVVKSLSDLVVIQKLMVHKLCAGSFVVDPDDLQTLANRQGVVEAVLNT